MKKWQTKAMLLSAGLVLAMTGTVAHDTMAFSDYTWESPEMKVSLTIPPTVSIGTYNATIQYELQNGVVNPR